jgi:GNAT superfamily N-acetyltransferase
MNIKKEKIKDYGVKFLAMDDGKEVGRTYLYILNNDLHEKPFGFIEDVFVEGNYRGQGIGKKLVSETIDNAKARGCYKLICTSRYGKNKVHRFYEKLGFTDHGKEFRMDF